MAKGNTDRVEDVKVIKDRSGGFNISLVLAGVALAVSTFAAGFTLPNTPQQFWARAAVVIIAIFIAITGYMKWRNERAFKIQQEDVKVSLQEQLRAERVRILTITNGAFQSTAKRLQDLAASDLTTRRREISGFRQSVVEKACDLVRSDHPRAAYFRIEDGSPFGSRKMATDGIVASRGRSDEFTTSFEEGSGRDSNVWGLIDNGDDAEMVLRIPEDVPEGFDLAKERVYKSYISVPVRAGTMAFGMLTINNLEAGGFDEQDKASMKVLSRLLAAAEAICVSASAQNRMRPNQSGDVSVLDGSMGLLEAHDE